jgi:molybdate transport repressor ModE-like protein
MTNRVTVGGYVPDVSSGDEGFAVGSCTPGMELSAEFDARIGHGDVTRVTRDVELLRAVDERGSVNAAATALDRSYPRAQRRIVELADAFGELVVRTRGGSGGGGSWLTDRARELLSRFDRLRVEFNGVAETAETVIEGRIVDLEGALATVETAAGGLRTAGAGAGGHGTGAPHSSGRRGNSSRRHSRRTRIGRAPGTGPRGRCAASTPARPSRSSPSTSAGGYRCRR